MLSIALLEKSVKTNIYIYPCGGTYIYIDVSSEEAFPRGRASTKGTSIYIAVDFGLS